MSVPRRRVGNFRGAFKLLIAFKSTSQNTRVNRCRAATSVVATGMPLTLASIMGNSSSCFKEALTNPSHNQWSSDAANTSGCLVVEISVYQSFSRE